MLVITPDPDAVRAKVRSQEGIQVVAEPNDLARILDRIQEDDLIIAPAYVVSSIGTLERWRVAKALRSVSAMVVAGPHRLSIDGTSVQRNLHGIVDSTEPTTAPI